MTIQKAEHALAITILAAALLLALTSLSLPFVGGFHDDGVYLVTGKALADGDGYVIKSLPDEIAQTKYPPLLPALFSVVWLLWPSFPENVVALRLIPLTAAIAWALVLWRLIAGEWRRSPAARWILPLSMTAPITFYLSLSPLSETLFGVLGAASILALARASRAPEDSALRQAIIAAVLCALAFYARTIGITLLACAAVAFPPWRRLKQALSFGLVWLALCAPWKIWQASHENPTAPVLAFYTQQNYTEWNTLTGSTRSNIEQIAGRNALFIALTPVTFWNLPLTPGFLLFGFGLSAAAGLGLIRQLSRPEKLAAVWVLATIGVTILWPWPPQRFLAPVLPFILLALVDSIPQRIRKRFRPLGQAAILAFTAWGLVTSASFAAQSRDAGVLRGPLGERDLTWADHSEFHQWVESATDPTAVLAGVFDPTYWLYCHRKAVMAANIDPVKLFYTTNSPKGALGGPDDLLEILESQDVKYLVFERSRLFEQTKPLQEQIGALLVRPRPPLKRVFESSSGRITVYKVTPPDK